MAKAKAKNEIRFNLMGHTLVPHHSVVSEKETKEVLKEFDITADQLPKLLDSDPVARLIGAKPGQVVKIVRNSQTAREAVAYRLVVESSL